MKSALVVASNLGMTIIQALANQNRSKTIDASGNPQVSLGLTSRLMSTETEASVPLTGAASTDLWKCIRLPPTLAVISAI